MATYTTNYNLEKPAQTDIYNVDVFNANADKIDAGLTDKAEKTMLAPVETTNSASRSYAKGEYFVYNNVLCCATTAIAAGGTIAIGTNCATAPVGGELKSLRDAFTNLTTVTQYNNDAFTPVSGVSSSNSRAVKTCQIVSMNLYFKVTSAKSGYTKFMTVHSGLKPTTESQIVLMNYDTNGVYMGYITTDGEIFCRSPLPTASLYVGRTTYACTQ